VKRGALIPLGFRFLILTATLALVTYWVPFAGRIQAETRNVSAAMVGTAGAPVDFTPDGVVLDASRAAYALVTHAVIMGGSE
jgi:hypothetical protein